MGSSTSDIGSPFSVRIAADISRRCLRTQSWVLIALVEADSPELRYV
jgi:hypothetical protein